MPTSDPDLSTDELRRFMQAEWGDMSERAAPLADTERAARLYGVVRDPYHRLAFTGRPTVELMHICAHGLLEQGQWDKAFRVISRIERIESQHDQKRAQLLAAIQAFGGPAEAEAPIPVPQATEPDLSALSDRELGRRLKAERRRRLTRLGKPARPGPHPAAEPAPPARQVANGHAARLPFT